MTVDVVGRMNCCTGCGTWSEEVRMRRQNTAYVDDSSNWAMTCDCCQEELDEHWAERWREYHSGLLGSNYPP